MENFLKYLTNNPEDRNWGIYLTVVGMDRVSSGNAYPLPLKQKGYYHFEWDDGRMLSEYQINYITEGEGVLEILTENYPIKEGTMLLLKPNQWHRYKPLEGTGWTEHFIGFKGDMAERMIENNPLLAKSPVISVGYQDSLLNSFYSIMNYVKYEKPGYQQACSGLLMSMLGETVWLIKNNTIWDTSVESIIQKSTLILRDNMHRTLKIEELSRDLDINYSLFRKAFKKYTGLSPNQYHLSLKLEEATYLLINTDKSIRDISADLGFCTVFYFSKIFKDKIGQSPTEFRSLKKTS